MIVASALGFGALVPSFSAPLQAQERIDTPYRWIDKGFRVGLYSGYLATDRGTLPFGPSSTQITGARLRARVSSPLSFELNVGIGKSDRFVVDPRPETGPVLADTVSLDFFVVQAAFQVALTGARTWHGVQPYILFGAGFVRATNQEVSGIFAPIEQSLRFELNTAPALELGAGAEFRPNDRFGISLEARDQLWRLKAPTGFFDVAVLDRIEKAGTTAPRETDWVHNLELTVGLYYYP